MVAKFGDHVSPTPNVEAVLLKFLKQLLNVRSRTSSAMVYGELGPVVQS